MFITPNQALDAPNVRHSRRFIFIDYLFLYADEKKKKESVVDDKCEIIYILYG